MGGLARWWGNLDKPQREGVGLGALLLAAVSIWIAIVITMHPTWILFEAVIAFMCVLVAAVTSLALANLLTQKARVRKIALGATIAILVVMLGVTVKAVLPAPASTGPTENISGMSDHAELTVTHAPQLIRMREQFKMYRGTRPDVRGHIVFDLVVVNPGPVTLKAHIYSAVRIRPFVSITADSSIEESEILQAKAEVRALFNKHNSQETAIEPGSEAPNGRNFIYRAIGPYVSDREWSLIANGDKYVYVYSLIAVNDDPESTTSIAICGIGNATEVDGCSPELEKW